VIHLALSKQQNAHSLSLYSFFLVKLSVCLTNQTLRHEDVWRSGCIDPRFLHHGTSWRLVSFTPRPLYTRGKESPVPIGEEAGWAPEPVWTTWGRENS
jgi:hypothetical protein